MEDAVKELDDIIEKIQGGKMIADDDMMEEINELALEIKRKEKKKVSQKEEAYKADMLLKLDTLAEILKEKESIQTETLQKVIKAIQAVKLIVPSPEVNVAPPEVNVTIPEIKIPPIKIPTTEVIIPDEMNIKRPSWLSSLINIKPITDAITDLKKSIKIPKVELPTTASKPISVRLSDGTKFYKALGGFVSSIGANFPFATSLNETKAALVDADGHVQVDVLNPSATNSTTGNNEILVNLQGHECPENSTTTQLDIDEVFTGSKWEDMLDFGVLTVNITTDQNSATNGLDIQWSNNGIDVIDHDYFTLSAGQAKTFTFGPAERYFRIVYTNGGVATTTLSITSITRRSYVKPSSHRMNDSIVGQDDAELVKSVLSAKRDGAIDTYDNIGADVSGNLKTVIGGISQDAGGRVRVSQLTTLGDYKTLNYDRTLLLENAGTGTGAFSANKYNMSVTAGQWFVRQSRRYHPYFSGKSQMFECTFDGFGLEADVVKRVGGFSSSATSPYSATLDGVWLENTGTSYVMKAARAGTETVSVDWTDWDNYDEIKNHDWSKFTVILIDFLWLGGAVYRLWMKNGAGFTLLHTVHYPGTATDVFILSPNQPVRYEIRSTTGSGSFRYICAQCSTEGSIDESGLGRTLRTGAITIGSIGTTYPLLALRKATTSRDIGVVLEDLSLFPTSANDQTQWSLQINPTLSAGLTYGALANSAVESAVGNGTITVTSPGTIINAGTASTNSQLPSGILKKNFLAWLGSTLNNTMDEYVLCATPITSNIVTYSTLSFKEI